MKEKIKGQVLGQEMENLLFIKLSLNPDQLGHQTASSTAE